MNKKDFFIILRHSQLLSGADPKSPASVVSHFGAMQAQDYQMAKWAIGARLKSASDRQIEQAIAAGEIIRMHILRPTWHFVAAEDIRWMLAISATSVLRQVNGSSRRLGLDERTLEKSNAIIQDLLSGGIHLTRPEIMKALSNNNIETHGHRGAHLMYHADLSGIVCNGTRKGKENTYALLDERVPHKPAIDKEAALAELARRYFSSHGPASMRDFIWWSGLPVADVRTAIALNPQLSKVTFDGEECFFVDSGLSENDPTFRMLPAFDEYMIAYKDRSAIIDRQYSPHAFTNNGIFRPLILIDGEVGGIWKVNQKKEISIELRYFEELDLPDSDIASEMERLEKFYEKSIILKSQTCHEY